MPVVRGKLYLIPSPIVPEGLEAISAGVVRVIHELDYFIVERARTARRFIRDLDPPKPIAAITFVEIQNEWAEADIKRELKPILAGESIGLLSEAGLPGIADPGQEVVRMAHEMDIEVIPLSGPSSIFMALMASGLEGQRFMFHGYLSAKKNELPGQLKELERRADRDAATQLWIEAPYRNHQVMEMMDQHLDAGRHITIAAGIGEENGFIKTKTLLQWRKSGWPEIHKVPTVFLLR